jgi:hypothetical protein
MAEGEAPTGKERPYWAPFVVALVMFAALVIIYLNPGLLSLSRFGLDFETLMNIGYLVIVIMLCLLVIWRITLSTEVQEAEALVVEEEKAPSTKAPAKVRPKRVVKEAAPAPEVEAVDEVDEELPEGLHRPEEVIEEGIEDLPRMIEYPKKEPGGVYSDTLIRVDTNLILNLRTLLGKVCHNCEELDDCKRRVKGKLDADVFLFNFECKDGLKRELQKARKKREAAKKAKTAKEMVEEKAAKAKVEEEEEEEEAEKPKKKSAPRKKGASKKGASKKKSTSKKGSAKGTKKKASTKK